MMTSIKKITMPSAPTLLNAQRMRVYLAIVFVMMLALYLHVNLAHAQTQNDATQNNTSQGARPSVEEQIGDWRFLCFGEGLERDCGAIQIQVNEKKQRVMEARIIRVNKDQIGLLVILPLGVRLQAGVAVAVDGTYLGTLQYNVCTQDGCQALAVLNEQNAEIFRKGSQAVLTIVAGKNNKVGVPLSLKGFTKSESRVRTSL